MKIKSILKLVDLVCNQMVAFTASFLPEDDFSELKELARDFQAKVHDILGKEKGGEDDTVIVIEKRVGNIFSTYHMHYDSYDKTEDRLYPNELESQQVDDFFDTITTRMVAPRIDVSTLTTDQKADLLQTIRG